MINESKGLKAVLSLNEAIDFIVPEEYFQHLKD